MAELNLALYGDMVSRTVHLGDGQTTRCGRDIYPLLSEMPLMILSLGKTYADSGGIIRWVGCRECADRIDELNGGE